MSPTYAATKSGIVGANEDGPHYRALPHNIEAEKALLGAILVDNRAFEKVSDYLRPEHFALAAHGRIFEACLRLLEGGRMADPVVLSTYLGQDEALAQLGGTDYLAELAATAVTIINAGEYGRIVFDLHVKRELIALGQEVVNKAYDSELEETGKLQIEMAEASLYKLATVGEFEGGFRSFRDAVVEAVKAAEAAHARDGGLAGVGTGLVDLDKLLGGLHHSDLVILAGRPSMGKTALATNIAYNAAADYKDSGGKEGAVVGFFSLEMSAEQLAARILSEQTEISSDRMRKGELSNEEFQRLVACSQVLYSLPIFIDDTPALSVSALRTRARRLKRQHGLGLIVVDYLQLIAASPGSRHDNRVQEVSEITRGLKTLAKELDVPVLALSQLSRAVEQREDKRPQLADLRESGSIEQDSDVVSFVFRQEYYLERDQPAQRADEKDDAFRTRMERWERLRDETRGIAEVIVAKQRHGPIGTVRLLFQGEFTRFSNLDRSHDGGF